MSGTSDMACPPDGKPQRLKLSRADLDGLDIAALRALLDQPMSPSTRVKVARALNRLGDRAAAAAALRARRLDSYNPDDWVFVGVVAATDGPDADTDALLLRYWQERPPQQLTARQARIVARWVARSGHPLPLRARWMQALVAAEACDPARDGGWQPPPLRLTPEDLEALTEADLDAVVAAPLPVDERLQLARHLSSRGWTDMAARALRAVPLADYPRQDWPAIGDILLQAGPAPDGDALLERFWSDIDLQTLDRDQSKAVARWLRLSGLPVPTRVLRHMALQRAIPTRRDGSRKWNLRAVRLTGADLARMTRAELLAFAGSDLPAAERLTVARFLMKIKYFRSAREALGTPLPDAYPHQDWPELAIILAQTEAAQPFDARLPEFIGRFESDAPGSRLAALTLAWLRGSALDPDVTLPLLARLARITPSDEPIPGAWHARVRWTEFVLRRAANHLVDVLDYVPPGPLSRPQARNYAAFIPHLRAEAHDARALELIEALRDPDQPGDIGWQLEMLRNYPTRVEIDQIGLPEASRARRDLIKALSPVQGLGPGYGALLNRALATMVDDFVQSRIVERGSILNTLIAHNHFQTARDALAAAGDIGDLILPARILDGWKWFEAEDYRRAHEAFRSVLDEDPANGFAMAGFRLTAVRNGEGFGAAVALRESAEGRSVPAGKTVKEQIWDFRTRGDLSQAALVQTQVSTWAFLKSMFGDRFLIDQDLDSLDADRHVFIIASSGVGDEIRFAKLYHRFAGRFARVTATCDPRLVGLLSRSFPQIDLIPCWRSRPGLTDRLDKMSGRKKGWNGLFYHLLTEEAGECLARADYIVNLGYLQYIDAQGPLRDTIDGRGFLIPPSGVGARGVADAGAPLRVGLLWRSHLLIKERRHMYLPVEGLSGLVGIPGVEFHAIQHDLNPAERAFCDANGIVVRDDIDLFDDFEGMSDYLSTLDLALGISSVPTELSAALGVPVWFLGFSPENYLLRTVGGRTEIDQLTVNARVIAAPDIDFSEPAGVCIAKTMREVRRRLTAEVAHRVRQGRK